MKEYRIMILLVSTLFIIAISCSSQLDNEDFSDMIGKGQNYTPPPIPVEEPSLCKLLHNMGYVSNFIM